MYLDTSVFVKLYAREPDSEACEATVAGKSVVLSRLLLCEFRPALLGKESRAVISRQTRDEAWLRFDQDVAQGMVVLVPLDDHFMAQAAGIMDSLRGEIPLRNLDALHLATFMGTEPGPLFTRDRTMIRAAERLGLGLAG